MFKNYMKIAWRNILQHKVFSLINIGGLAIGLSCCLLILMFIQDEFSYDRIHGKADRIYRVVASTSEDRVPTNANGSFGYGPLLKEEFPGVLESVRIRKMGQGVKRYLGYKGKKFYEEWFFFAEPAIFTVFDFPLIKGNPGTALSEPNTIVLTEEMAEKYFQSQDPLGKIIEADPYNTGEPFLNYDLLLKAVEMADEYHIPSTFVETNCFWCTNDETTREKLVKLKEAGLRGIMISVGSWWDINQLAEVCIQDRFFLSAILNLRSLFDENRDPPFQPNLKSRIRSREAKSGNCFGIFG